MSLVFKIVRVYVTPQRQTFAFYAVNSACWAYFVCQKKMNTEARVKSEGKAGREDPTWNYRGGVTELLKRNKKCVPETSLKRTVLVRGADANPCQLIGTFRGGWAGGSLFRGSLLWAGWAGGSRLRGSLRGSSADPLASPGSAATFLLCRLEARFLPSAVLLLPSLCPGFSRLLPARLETQASPDLPSSQWAVLTPPSSLRAGLTGCLGFITESFLPRSFLHSWWWDVQGNWRHFWISLNVDATWT